VVERGGLENRYTFTGIGGSNPPLSASAPLARRKLKIAKLKIENEFT
jgi:hypothetical protein